MAHNLPTLQVGDIIGGGGHDTDRLVLDNSEESDKSEDEDEDNGDEDVDGAESQATTARSEIAQRAALPPAPSAITVGRAHSLYQKPIGSAGGARMPGSPTSSGSGSGGGLRRGSGGAGVRVPLQGVQPSGGGGATGMSPHPPPRGGGAGAGGDVGGMARDGRRGGSFRAPLLVPEAQ